MSYYEPDDSWDEIGDPAEEAALERLEETGKLNQEDKMTTKTAELTDWVAEMGQKYVQLGRTQVASEILLRIKTWAQDSGSADCYSVLQEILALCGREADKLKELTDSELMGGKR